MDHYNKPSPRVDLLSYSKLSPQECLVHHGILGQRWGKRNGPPYPLDASDHSASEKKAGWRKSLDKGSGKTDNKSRAKSRGSERNGLTDNQKRALKIGAAVAITALAVYGGYKLKESGKLEPLIDKGKKLTDDILGQIGDKPVGSFEPVQAKETASIRTIGLQFFAEKASDFKTVRLPKKEYAHVMSELMTHTTAEQRSKHTFIKCIGKFAYRVENMEDGNFRIIDRVEIANGIGRNNGR